MPLARLARPVAAGLVLGAFAGFLSALLRPRSVPSAARINLVDLVDNGLRSRLLAVAGPPLGGGTGQPALAHSSGLS